MQTFGLVIGATLIVIGFGYRLVLALSYLSRRQIDELERGLQITRQPGDMNITGGKELILYVRHAYKIGLLGIAIFFASLLL